MKYSFWFGQHVATWKDIEAVYERDSALPIGMAPKLTENHIHLNNFKKIKVKLATQVISHTVAASLCTYVSVGALPSSAMGTAKKLKCALHDQSAHLEFMKKTIVFILGLNVFDRNAEVNWSD